MSADANSPFLKLGGPRVFILINGILSNPGESDGWTDRGVTWLNLHSTAKAEKFEYACSALTRRLKQQQRAEAIAKMCGYYYRAGYNISLIGHSNGCDLIGRVLEITAGQYRYESLHLFAAAADDFEFAASFDENQIGHLFLYVSANDRALQLAGISKKLFGWAGLGYGSMGRDVPAWCTTNLRVTITRRDDYGHSSWFERGENFESTMREVVRLEEDLLCPF